MLKWSHVKFRFIIYNVITWFTFNVGTGVDLDLMTWFVWLSPQWLGTCFKLPPSICPTKMSNLANISIADQSLFWILLNHTSIFMPISSNTIYLSNKHLECMFMQTFMNEYVFLFVVPPPQNSFHQFSPISLPELISAQRCCHINSALVPWTLAGKADSRCISIARRFR